MAQFDVFANTGRQRHPVPYFVALQNARYDGFTSRFVAPPVLRSAIRVEMYEIAPWFTVAGHEVVLDVLNLATIPTDRLGRAVASLADEDSRAKLVRAMDEFLS